MQKYAKIRLYIGYAILILALFLATAFFIMAIDVGVYATKSRYFNDVGAIERPYTMKLAFIIITLLCALLSCFSSRLRFGKSIKNDEIMGIVMDGISIVALLVSYGFAIYVFFVTNNPTNIYLAVAATNAFAFSLSAASDVHDQVLSSTLLKSNDVACFISYSGESRDLLKTLKIAKQEGAHILSITSNEESVIAQLSDLALLHSAVGEGVRTNATSSRLVQLNVIDVLFAQLTSLRIKELEKFHSLTNTVFLGDKNLGRGR